LEKSHRVPISTLASLYASDGVAAALVSAFFSYRVHCIDAALIARRLVHIRIDIAATALQEETFRITLLFHHTAHLANPIRRVLKVVSREHNRMTCEMDQTGEGLAVHCFKFNDGCLTIDR
jgi:hypothetical protein